MEQQVESAAINGVDVEQLLQTIDAIKANEEIAKFKFRATNKWIDGGHNQTTITDFYGATANHPHQKPFELEEDEHQVLLGNDIGPNPVEYALAALAGCLTSSLVYHSAAKGIKIRGVESRLEGDIDLRGFLGLWPDIKAGYENIRVYFKIDADIPEEQKKELIEMAKKYSPVFDTIANPVSVSVELEK